MAYKKRDRAFEFLSLPFLDILTVVVGGLGAALMVSVPGLIAGRGPLVQLSVDSAEALPPAAYLEPYEMILAAHGGVPPYQWSIDSGEDANLRCRQKYGPNTQVGLPPGLRSFKNGTIKGVAGHALHEKTQYCIPILVRGQDMLDPKNNKKIPANIVTKEFTISLFGRREDLDIVGPTSIDSPLGAPQSILYQVRGTNAEFYTAIVSGPQNAKVSRSGREISITAEIPLSMFDHVGETVDLTFEVQAEDGQVARKHTGIHILPPQISFDKLYIRTDFVQPIESIIGQSTKVSFSAVGGAGDLTWSRIGGCCLDIDSRTGAATIFSKTPGQQQTRVCVSDSQISKLGLDGSACLPITLNFQHPDIKIESPGAVNFIDQFPLQHVIQYNVDGGAGTLKADVYIDEKKKFTIADIARGDNEVDLSTLKLRNGVYGLTIAVTDDYSSFTRKDIVVKVLSKADFPATNSWDLPANELDELTNIGFGCKVGYETCDKGAMDLRGDYELPLLGQKVGNISVIYVDLIKEKPASSEGTWSVPPGMNISKESDGWYLVGKPTIAGVFQFGFIIGVSPNRKITQNFSVTVRSVEDLKAALERAEEK